jgi:hypothetical protein
MSNQLIGATTSSAAEARARLFSLPTLLAWIVVAVVAIDCIWDARHGFDIDLISYSKIALVSLGFAAGGLFYIRVRKSPHLAAMLWGAAFLIGFSAAMNLLNYFLLTVAGPRIDVLLAHIDAALGIDWPAMVTAMTAHRIANLVLLVAYGSSMPQILLLLGCLGWKERSADIYEFCLALAISAMITVGFWAVFPSIGAFTIYELPAGVYRQLHLMNDSRYAHDLIGLLTNGPGRISPYELKGLIAFPSFHTIMAVLVVWYVRSFRGIVLALLAWNAVVLASIPIHGGHHVIDIPAGIAVAAVSIWLAISIHAHSRNRADVADFTESSANLSPERCPVPCD